MAMEFPLPAASPWTDDNGQKWVHNGQNWVRQAADPGIEEAPTDGQQYVRASADWVLNNPDEWYLGTKSSAPFVNNSGGALSPGNVYYNSVTKETLIWDGTYWVTFSPVYAVETGGEFTWDSHAEIAIDGSPVFPDDYGNVPSNWVNGKTKITVFVDGLLKLQEYDAGAVTGDYIVDYANNNIIIKNAVIPANAKLVIREAVASTRTGIEPTDDNASGFAFVIDEDDMRSDLDTKVPTQQSVKAFVEQQVAMALEGIDTGVGGATGARNIGEVFDFAGTAPPDNALVCEGQTVAIADYPLLYNVIGDTWANTGGVENPLSGDFRLPPSFITRAEGTFGLYGRGASPDVPVGTYQQSQNLRHQHNADHNHNATVGSAGDHTHTGSTNTTGNHVHTEYGGAGGTYKTDDTGAATVLKTNRGSTTSAGSHSHSLSLNSAGGHTHTLSLESTNVNTANEGGLDARPESITFLKCIWAS